MPRPFYLAVDFDGTIVDHRYPAIGEAVPGAVAWLRRLRDAGATLILWTMRSDNADRNAAEPLSEAVAWCGAAGIALAFINKNPTQRGWTSSPKAYAHAYVDDAAIGCPLRENPRLGGRPYVDWDLVGPAVLALLEAHHGPRNAPTP